MSRFRIRAVAAAVLAAAMLAPASSQVPVYRYKPVVSGAVSGGGSGGTDLTPDGFSFTPAVNAEPNAALVSNVAQLNGHSGVSVEITGGPGAGYQLCTASDCSDQGGTWITAPTPSVPAGQYVRVSVTSSATFGGTASATLKAGEVEATFTVTTRAKDTTPDGFSFTSATNVTPNQPAYSNSVVLMGHEGVDLSVSGGGYQFCSTAACTEMNGQPIQTAPYTDAPNGTRLRLVASPTANNEVVTVSLTAGTVTRTYTAATPDTVPNTFAFTPLTGQALNTQIQSNLVTISGISTATPVSVSGDGTPQFSINGSTTWRTSSTITNGQTLRVRLTSANAENTARTATVNVGGVTATFDVTTGDATPDAFTVAPLTGQALNTQVTSAAVTITGITAPATVTVSGEGSPQFSVNGTTFRSTAATITNGQTLRVRLTSASTTDTKRTATVTVGGVPATFEVTTGSTTPDPFTFADVLYADPNRSYTSAPINFTGLASDATMTITLDGDYGSQVDGWTNNGNHGWIGAPFPFTTTIPATGGYVEPRMVSPNGYNGESRTLTVNVGGRIATWTIKVKDETADPVASLPSITGAAKGVYFYSDPITVTGFDSPIGVVPGGTAYVSVNGGTWSPHNTINPGQTFRLRVRSSAWSHTTETTVVEIGGFYAPKQTMSWSITTGP